MGGFYEVTPDEIAYSFESDLDLVSSTSFIDLYGNLAYFYTYDFFHEKGPNERGKSSARRLGRGGNMSNS